MLDYKFYSPLVILALGELAAGRELLVLEAFSLIPGTVYAVYYRIAFQ